MQYHSGSHSPEGLSTRLDRHSRNRQEPGWLASIWQRADTLVLRLDTSRAPITDADSESSPDAHTVQPRLHLLPAQGELPEGAVYLGEAAHRESPAPGDGTGPHLVTVPAPGAAAEETRSATGQRIRWEDLRSIGNLLPAEEAEILAQATAVLAWHTVSQFCPACGGSTTIHSSGWMRTCPSCGAIHFPRTDPAVITAVIDPQDRLLLGSAVHWDAHRYSTFAGFVEAGESVEAAVVREVEEEAGAHIDHVEYLSSQAWPFPRSLMLGFLGHTRDSQAKADQDEIRDVRWFTRTELRESVLDGTVRIPPRSSISRALIEHWYGDRLPDEPISAPSGFAVR